METKRISRPVMVVLAVIAAAGAAAWIYQTMFGLGVTGMNNGTSWGLYIAAFMFFVGLSAGGLIVASSASIDRLPSRDAAACSERRSRTLAGG